MEALLMENPVWRWFMVVVNIVVGAAIAAVSGFCVFFYGRAIYRLFKGLTPFGDLSDRKAFKEPVQPIRHQATGTI